MHGVHDAMREAKALIERLAPNFAASRLSLDVRAALLNLDGALTRAISHDGDNLGSGADHLDVYSRLAALRDTASAEGPQTLAIVEPVLGLLERRRDGSARDSHPSRPNAKR